MVPGVGRRSGRSPRTTGASTHLPGQPGDGRDDGRRARGGGGQELGSGPTTARDLAVRSARLVRALHPAGERPKGESRSRRGVPHGRVPGLAGASDPADTPLHLPGLPGAALLRPDPPGPQGASVEPTMADARDARRRRCGPGRAPSGPGLWRLGPGRTYRLQPSLAAPVQSRDRRPAAPVNGPNPGQQPRHHHRPVPQDIRGRLPVRPAHVGDTGSEGDPLRGQGQAVQRHRSLEADGAPGRALQLRDAGVPDHSPAGAPRRTPHRHLRDGAAPDQPQPRVGPGGRVVSTQTYDIVVATGGIGSGMFLALEGDHTLGREESRAVRVLDQRDFCKLHIVTHYVQTLLGPDFPVVPIGRVGTDEAGNVLRNEMAAAGLDLTYVQDSPRSTLLSICFLYPSGDGGNLTTDDSASAAVSPWDVAQSAGLFNRHRDRGVAVALPEVSLATREAQE